jgi:hypothetical protein
MFVRVRGPVNGNKGVAERIGADHLLQGPVDAVNAADGTFSALSQLVITGPDTVFDQTDIQTLAPGDVVEVFGVRDADLGIRATRVEKKDPATEEFELTGNIAGLDLVAQTFRIGILTVDFSSAVVENAPPTGLADGLLVEAESDEAPVGDVLAATGIEVIDPALEFEEGDAAEVHGFVTSVVSATEIVLNGTQRVLLTESTRFERGTRADLVLNAEIEVDGTLDATGVITGRRDRVRRDRGRLTRTRAALSRSACGSCTRRDVFEGSPDGSQSAGQKRVAGTISVTTLRGNFPDASTRALTRSAISRWRSS